MSNDICRKQTADRQFPNFTLESIDDIQVSLWNFRNRYNVALLFFDPSLSDDLDTLNLFSMKDPEFADSNAEILAIAINPDEPSILKMKNMSIPFHILVDRDNIAKDKLNIHKTPCVAVMDRYGMLLMMYEEYDNIHEVLEDIISELQAVEMQCPECGVDTWGADH